MKRIETTLCLLEKDQQILLGLKKRGFGEGKYNGVGGKLEPGETKEEALLREVREEIGINLLKYDYRGKIEFIELYQGNKTNLIFYLYTATSWEGDIIETEEIKPYWFNKESIPYAKMFNDDKFWLPYILKGHNINAFFEFDDAWNILKQSIDIIK